MRIYQILQDMAEDYKHPGWSVVCVGLALLCGVVI